MTDKSMNPVKAALLQALVPGEAYGLELADRVQSSSGIKLHQGVLYPALRAMEREGLLESFTGEPVVARGGRPRRYYRLAEAGKRAAAGG